MKTRTRYRPTVEHLESLNLMSNIPALPIVPMPPHETASTDVVKFYGAATGSFHQHYADNRLVTEVDADTQYELSIFVNNVGYVSHAHIHGTITPVGKQGVLMANWHIETDFGQLDLTAFRLSNTGPDGNWTYRITHGDMKFQDATGTGRLSLQLTAPTPESTYGTATLKFNS
jgi:hypothetical protein